MITLYDIPRTLILDYLSNRKEKDEVQKIVSELFDERVKQNASFYLLAGSLLTVNLEPFSFKFMTTDFLGRSYSQLVSEIFRAIPKLNWNEKSSIRAFLAELEIFAEGDHYFKRNVEVKAIRKKIIELFYFGVVRAEVQAVIHKQSGAHLKAKNEISYYDTRFTNELSLYYRIQQLIEKTSLLIKKGRSLNRMMENFKVDGFNVKPITLEGKAFLKRWVTFNQSTLPTLKLKIEEIGDFTKKYLNSKNKEVKIFAEYSLQIFEVFHLAAQYDQVLLDLKHIVSFIFKYPQQYIIVAKQIGMKDFETFINKTDPFFKPLINFVGTPFQLPQFSNQILSQLEKDNQLIVHFLPTLKFLYGLYYQMIDKEEIYDANYVERTHKLPSPLEIGSQDDHVTNYFELLQEFDRIEDLDEVKTEKKADKEKIVVADVKPSVTESKVNDSSIQMPLDNGSDWKVVEAKIKPKPKLRYDARVLKWFDEMDHTPWLNLPPRVRAHTFSSLVDQFVDTSYSLESQWCNTKTQHSDKRYLLPAELITTTGTSWVVFRYTKGADDIWYHRDMATDIDDQFWEHVKFPKLKPREEKPKVQELTSAEGHWIEFERETDTILIHCGDYSFRLFKVN